MSLNEYFPLLITTELFSGIETSDLAAVLGCIGAKTTPVKKGGIVLLAGDTPKHVGVVLAGQLQVIREGYDGDRTLIAVLSPGDIFAEALCCAGVPESPVTVAADSDSAVMLMGFERILHTCPNSCSFHRKLIRNMLGLIADKNLKLQSHMEILAMKSIRARLTRYLESFSGKPGHEIVIPLNREELANYLCVDRSALSHELMNMKKAGLIEYRKNRFVIKRRQ